MNQSTRKNAMTFQPILAAAFILFGATSGRAEEALLDRDVLPILTKQCLGCHGGLRQKGGLDLRTVTLMLKGGDSGPALKSGNANVSAMWNKIDSDEMPPNEKKLSPAEKATIKQWIASGLPTVAQRQKDDVPLLAAGVKHEPTQVAAAIDRHLDGALAAAKLKAAARADDDEFLRRVYIDMSGRVPTAVQAAAFLDSKELDKRAKLIDTLLATPQFGQQFGRTWRDWIAPPELPSDANGGGQPHKQVQNLGDWLGKRFAAGDSWDKITREILTVDGRGTGDKQQVIFFGLVGEGVQLQCAQCHDDPYRDWAQREFWAQAAFFRKTTGGFNDVTEKVSMEPGKTSAQITIPKSAFKNAGNNVPAAFLGGKAFEPATNIAFRRENGTDLDNRLELLAGSESRFAQDYSLPAVGIKQAAFDRAVRLMRSKRAKAFNLDEEPAKLREAVKLVKQQITPKAMQVAEEAAKALDEAIKLHQAAQAKADQAQQQTSRAINARKNAVDAKVALESARLLEAETRKRLTDLDGK